MEVVKDSRKKKARQREMVLNYLARIVLYNSEGFRGNEMGRGGKKGEGREKTKRER